MAANRVPEFLGALERLRQATQQRLDGYASGHRRVLHDDLDVTEQSTASMKAELAQIEWLIEQMSAEKPVVHMAQKEPEVIELGVCQQGPVTGGRSGSRG